MGWAGALGGLMLVGTALQTAGTLRAGNQADAQAKANARAVELEGREAQEQATAQGEARTREARRIMARQRALIGESGLAGEGSLAAIQAETAEQSTLDALALYYGGKKARNVAGYEAKGIRQRGRSAKQAGYIQAGAGLLLGGAQTGASYTALSAPGTSTAPKPWARTGINRGY